MAFDEYQAERITRIFQDKKASFFTKKMMGGLCFMVNDKMACAVHYDKKKETDLLMARIGELAEPTARKKLGCVPMDFTGRPMKGYVFVMPEGWDTDIDLEYWIDLVLDFNPLAKVSKKRKKKVEYF